jgi:Flp pilus assembly protein TadD
MTAAAALASMLVAAVAAAAVMRPFRRGGPPVLERLPDPLEDERRSLLRSLKELDEEHAAGTIADEDYRSLRRDTEVRAVAVLKTLAAREGRPPTLREIRPASGNGHRVSNGSRRRAALPVLVATAVVFAVAVPLLAGAIGGRSGGQAITGDNSSGGNELTIFQRRVVEHPTDVAARLDLAARYEAAGDLTDASTQYLAALRLNPSDSEANAAVAYLLFLSGDAQAALRHAERSLGPDATYPEGLWMKGLILARGLHRDAAAARALHAYLQAAPYGSHRSQALRILAKLSG